MESDTDIPDGQVWYLGVTLDAESEKPVCPEKHVET